MKALSVVKQRLKYATLNGTSYIIESLTISFGPSIRDRVHRNENFVEIIPV